MDHSKAEAIVNVTTRAAPWIERLARLGYISKGVVFVIIGLFAAAAGLGSGGHIADKKDAFSEILHKPFGQEMLFVIAAGLAGYALWQMLSGLTDTERRGTRPGALLMRAGSVIRGAMYAWIAFGVVRFALRTHEMTSSDANARAWTAKAMEIIRSEGSPWP